MSDSQVMGTKQEAYAKLAGSVARLQTSMTELSGRLEHVRAVHDNAESLAISLSSALKRSATKEVSTADAEEETLQSNTKNNTLSGQQ
eukprot:2532215-Rhodomonas_salina.1